MKIKGTGELLQLTKELGERKQEELLTYIGEMQNEIEILVRTLNKIRNMTTNSVSEYYIYGTNKECNKQYEAES